MEWPIAMCGHGAPLFVGIQFFEVSASSADCADPTFFVWGDNI